MKKTASAADFFLPDFCQVQSVFFVTLLAELLAVIFTLLNLSPQGSLWNLLGLYSISIQIISLVSVSGLCLLRPYLARFDDWISGAMSAAVVLLTTLLFSLAVIHWYWLQPFNWQDPAQRDLLLRNLLIAGLIGAVVLRYFYLQQQYRKQLVLESAARLQALQARIRPHFLFNSMNVIASLTRIDPIKAEAAIEDLSDLFRATLNQDQSLIPLAQELANGDKYLAIEQLRMGDRLQVQRNIDERALAVMVPPLSLQPLLENAVYHGIQQIAEGGVLTIVAQCADGNLTLKVSNPRVEGRQSKGHGMALQNISQRLDMIYHGKASLHKQPGDAEFVVTLCVPLNVPDF